VRQVEILTGSILIAVFAVALAYLVVVTLRKQQLLGRPGGLPLAVRYGVDKWSIGVGRYAGDSLLWYGALRLGRRPNRILRRATLEVTGQRGRRADEMMLVSDAVIVECLDDGEKVSLAFSAAAVMGFLSWLEASAPRW
jgi:hypothetical protein